MVHEWRGVCCIFFASVRSKDTWVRISLYELMIAYFLCIYTGCIGEDCMTLIKKQEVRR